MYYEINVSQFGRRLFATDKRSLQDKKSAKHVYDLLAAAFPMNAGYNIMITKFDKVGQIISPNSLE